MAEKSDDSFGCINLYPSETYHAPAGIVLDPTGLKQLRSLLDELDRAQLKGEAEGFEPTIAKTTVFDTSGEGHDFTVVLVPEAHLRCARPLYWGNDYGPKQAIGDVVAALPKGGQV